MESNPLPATAGQSPHPVVAAAVRFMAINHAVDEVDGVSRWKARQVVREKVDDAMITMAAAQAFQAANPSTRGAFGDWLKTVDWAKVLQIVFQIIQMILPFLIAV